MKMFLTIIIPIDVNLRFYKNNLDFEYLDIDDEDNHNNVFNEINHQTPSKVVVSASLIFYWLLVGVSPPEMIITITHMMTILII